MAKSKYIETPEKMWDLFLKYITHSQENPLHRVDYVGRDGNKTLTPLAIPITFNGFENYLAMKGVINDLGDYSKNDDGRYEDYAPIITRIRNYCYVNNFNGAAVNLLNANLISRKLGLVDKKSTEHSGSLKIPNLPDIGNR